MRARPLSLALAGLLPVVLAACSADSAPVEAARTVFVVHPTAGESGGALAYAGEVRAREESPLAFRVGGNLVERHVDVGDHVRRGDLLATLDPGDLQAQARAARAQLAAAQAQLQRARADQARFAALGREQLVSRSTVDAQNAATAAAQGQVAAARESLAVASNQAAYTQLRAPRDGVIAARQAEAGQVVAAGQAVFALAADGSREVAFAVPEGAVRSVRPGHAVQIELWSQPGRRLPGRVREIAPAADPVTRTYAARATFDAGADGVDLGQSARVHLDRGTGAGLTVPLAAIQRSAKGDAAVFVVDPATATLRLRPVQVGAYGSEHVPVLRGVAANEWVVAAGAHLLRPGQKVRPVDRDNRPVR
ncbi:efflux RND transporter periplasmic adaptor subunit [Lysobacter humi (ex Lee et al. 2017)]